MSSSEWEGKTHTITVTSATPPDGPLDTWHLEYEIDHPGCPLEDVGGYDDYRCDVGWLIDSEGIEFALEYSGTPITEPGTYKIRGWGSKTYYPSFGAYEYDAGIAVVDEE